MKVDLNVYFTHQCARFSCISSVRILYAVYYGRQKNLVDLIRIFGSLNCDLSGGPRKIKLQEDVVFRTIIPWTTETSGK
jgi:hypothetical protein